MKRGAAQTLSSKEILYDRLWRDMVQEITKQYELFSASEREWIGIRLKKIGDLQERMHSLFLSAQGEGICLRCEGACCDCGQNHFSLVNLLSFVAERERPPEPDFSRPCPFLGASGCRLEPRRRPYSCLTFLCEPAEQCLTDSDLAVFYAGEEELRSLYADFDRRYAGSSLRGLLIRADRIGVQHLLDRLPESP